MKSSKLPVNTAAIQKIVFYTLFIMLFTQPSLFAQDLMDLLEEESVDPITYTTATFKATRIINGHSIERMPEGQLDFRIHHRFGRLNDGAYELWGLDHANIHFGLDYGFTDWLMLGVGRGTYEKSFDGLAKFSILRQSSGSKNMPVSLTFLSTMALNSLKWADPEQQNYFSSRMAYTFQVLAARKFSERLSLQIMPTIVHKNLVQTELDMNDMYSMGFGGRFKITKRLAFNAEYFYVYRPQYSSARGVYYDSFSVGLDIETGGHVFQLVFTNSQPMIEKGFITETTGNWLDGDIHFGFNISRVFALK
jgi:hypothetical protein